MTCCGPGEILGAACCSVFASRLAVFALDLLISIFFDRRSALCEELICILGFRSFEENPADCEDCEEREDFDESDDRDECGEGEDREHSEHDEAEDRGVREPSEIEGGGVGRSSPRWPSTQVSRWENETCSERARACS